LHNIGGFNILYRLIEHINKHEGVEWVTMGEMCDDFKKKHQPAPGAKLPVQQEEVFRKLGINKQT
jgi:hypothetical protein